MTSNEKRTLAVKYMTDRAGKNAYTQGSKRKYFFGYPDNDPANTAQSGFSDCSSAVRCAIQKASGLDIGSNTSAQINNRAKKGKIVHETTGFYPDESKLKIGDCLYFKGNSKHPLSVGHVEMYIGDGKLCGHGGGTGTQIKSIASYCKSRATSKRRYFMTVRWIQDDSAPAACEPEVHTVTVASGAWNLRTGPATSYPAAGIVRGGDKLEKIDLDGWAPVQVGDKALYLSPKAVEK